MLFKHTAALAVTLVMCSVLAGLGAGPGRLVLRGHVPAAVARLAPIGRLPETNILTLAIGLPLRNQQELGELIRQLYDPASTNYHKYLSVAEFTARFGPAEQDYAAVRQFAESNGFAVVGTHPNRLVLDVTARVPDIEHAFQIKLQTYHDPVKGRDFFAPDREPSVPANLSVVDVEGLDNYAPPQPLLRRMSRALAAEPLSFNGTGPNGEYAGRDFRNAYVPGTVLTGAGQAVGLLELAGYYQVDITNYENIIGQVYGVTNYVPLTNVVISQPSSKETSADNSEVALDIEMAISMAPGLSRVIVYEDGQTAPATIMSRMASDNLAKQFSSSWTWSGGPDASVDSALLEMQAQGQSYFQAAGDSDAYTGANALDNAKLTDAPVDSTNLVAVGGTTLTMNGNGVSWNSETVWNWNTSGNPNVGSGGGSSSYYTIPWWQSDVSMMSNSGSTTFRNIPDVALTADNIFVSDDDGDDSGSEYSGGTSCAAPLWAGFTALINQQSAAAGHSPVGFLNPALYAIGTGTNYATCFHDINTGNNVGTNTPGLYNATNGYDLCTGWGTPTGTNLINALVPYPGIVTPPANVTTNSGSSASFSVIAAGSPMLSFNWQFNGTNLANGGKVSGATSSVLTLTAVATNNAGNYRVVVANTYGSITSSVATLTVSFPTNLVPGFTNVARSSSGSVTLGLSGASGYSYVLEATTNLASPNWVPLTTNMPGTNGFWQYTDTSATNYPLRFYRLLLSQ